MEVKSRYRWFGGFSIFVFLLLVGCFMLYSSVFDAYARGDEVGVEFFVYLFYSLQMLWLMWRFVPRIRMDYRSIRFHHPLFPFIKKEKMWSEYDYVMIVDEKGKYGPSESIWLMKNDRLKKRVMSRVYKNYEAIKTAIPIENKGKVKLNQWTMIKGFFGGKVRTEKH